eukprot:COSAG02_NODE_8408_length_2583_cov_1.143720_2_plen_66_part_01
MHWCRNLSLILAIHKRIALSSPVPLTNHTVSKTFARFVMIPLGSYKSRHPRELLDVPTLDEVAKSS